MADTRNITDNLLGMYGRNDWIMRTNFDIFLRRSGLMDLPRDVRILDLGCAMGHLILQLRQAGFQRVTGLDASPEMVEAARGLTGGDILLGDAAACGDLVEAGGFDVVIISDLVHHIEDESGWDRMLDGCRTALGPGGLLVIREPWPTPVLNLLYALSRFSWLHLGPLKERLRSFVEEDALLQYFFSHWIPDYPERLQRRGFRVERDFSWLVHRITVCRRDDPAP